ISAALERPPAAGLRMLTACRAGVALPLPGGAGRTAAGAANADPEGEGAIPFSASKASPRVWSVSQSMGSDYQRPWVKVLPLSLLCSGLLLWCAFREKTEIDERLEALLSGQIADPLDAEIKRFPFAHAMR
uniref:Protein CCSMST1 n=1 Tax=Pavo cristatus TaxID=9049 RepID=A0A8C9F2U1_PAVCR